MKILDKVLDNKVSKKVMIPVGNKIIGGTKKAVKFLDKQFVEPSRNYNKIQKDIDDKNRKNMEWEKTGQVAKRKGRSTSDGRMLG